MQLTNERVRQIFETRFGDVKRLIHVRAPGRVNLIGEHTDYNDGLVLPFAIDRYVHFIGDRSSDRYAQIYAADLDVTRQLDLNRLATEPEGSWIDYVIGILRELDRRGWLGRVGGFNALIAGDVPIGAGLSSSAALEVAVAYGLARLFDLRIPELELVQLCQQAERTFVGANVGIMDQYVAVYGKQGKALLLDTRTLEHEAIDLPFQAHKILVVDTRTKRELAESEYNVRRGECEESVRLFGEQIGGLASLRDLTAEQFAAYRDKLPQRLARRVQHVIEENIRVRETAEALRIEDLDRVGGLLYASHHSLRDLFEVSAPELDFLVDLARSAGILGARMVGGGFGGATIHLVELSRISEYQRWVNGRFHEEFGVEAGAFEVAPSDGVTVVTSETG
ncbi:MAG: galactokinase [Candidatus Bipolaricaulia bacterium]